MSHANSLRSIFWALGANLAIFAAKLAAAVYTGSGAMMAEAIHSLADSGNQLLLLFGLRRARRPPSPDYPLGWGKAVYFWSFVVALILFSMGGVYSDYEGWHKLHHPPELGAPWVGVAVLLFAAVAEGLSLRGCLQEVRKLQGEKSLWRWFRETRHSELLVVFGEDTAALAGLALALAAVAASAITGNPAFDAYGSMAIGALLVFVALMIAVEVKALLIGQGVEPEVRREMLDFLAAQPEVAQVFNLLTLQLGPDVMVAVKARMVPQGSDTALIEAINRCERAFRQRFPQVMWLFFEPDVQD